MAASCAAKGNGPTNGGLVGVENLGLHPTIRLTSDLILLAYALIVRPHLVVRKNPEKLKKVNVDLTGHTYDGRCKCLVHESIGVLVLVGLEIGTSLYDLGDVLF